MESAADTPTAALAALAWQVELGADEAILDTPVNRYDLPGKMPSSERQAAQSAQPAAKAEPARPGAAPLAQGPEGTADVMDAVQLAKDIAAKANSLPELHEAMAAFEHCGLKQGARNTVFAGGLAGARVMLIGEAPDRDEDRQAEPFVGRAGQLLDRMCAAIGLSRSSQDPAEAIYITNVVPWRPPQNRTPEAGEIALCRPFLERHIALAKPRILVLMGNTPCQALLGRSGITRMRGDWTETQGLPTLPMVHPASLLRKPAAKREAWADLLALKHRTQSL